MTFYIRHNTYIYFILQRFCDFGESIQQGHVAEGGEGEPLHSALQLKIQGDECQKLICRAIVLKNVSF